MFFCLYIQVHFYVINSEYVVSLIQSLQDHKRTTVSHCNCNLSHCSKSLVYYFKLSKRKMIKICMSEILKRKFSSKQFRNIIISFITWIQQIEFKLHCYSPNFVCIDWDLIMRSLIVVINLLNSTISPNLTLNFW